MALTPGTRLGPYEIVSPLGAGGMGEVYRARDTKLDRDVALKILPESFAADPDRVMRFEREAKTLASLNHPNIAAIYGLEGRALVMELVEGEDLSSRIARGAIPLADALPIARQITDALEAAHAHGIVHRDLKPANIKIRDDGTVKVLDFGLAKAVDVIGTAETSARGQAAQPTMTSPALTAMGMILGTATYMAPEQARGRPVDKRADIWAFGCVLYEMLAGKRLFDGEDITETLAAVVKEQPDLTAAPASVRRLLQKCLEKDPRRRLRDIGDAWDLVDDPVSAESSPAPALRSLRLPWTIAAVAVVAAAVLAVVQFTETPAPAWTTRFVVPWPVDSSAAGAAGGGRFLELSPDGRHLAIVSQGALWVRSLDALEPVRLARTEGATYPFWSPDSGSIGFFAAGQLKKIARTGGSAVTICDAPEGRGAAWSPNGTVLFSAKYGYEGLSRVPEGGGTPTPVTRVTTSGASDAHRYPQFLPDGEHFLYLHLTGVVDVAGVYVGALDGTTPARVLEGQESALYAAATGSDDGHLLFLREGTLMAQAFDPTGLRTAAAVFPVAEGVGQGENTGLGAFSVSKVGALAHRGTSRGEVEMVWVDRSGERLGMASPTAAISSFSLAHDERRLAIAVDAGSNRDASDIWVQALPGGSPSKFTFGPPPGWLFPLWSPGGDEIAYATYDLAGLAGYEIRRKASNMAGAEETLLRSGDIIWLWDWSPDGQSLVYSKGKDLWLLPLDDGRTPVQLTNTPAEEVYGQVSPDGLWLAWASGNRGAMDVYVQPFPATGALWLVSKDGGTMPRWRRDGKELFFRGGDGQLMAVAIGDGRPESPGFQHGAPRHLFGGVTSVGNVDRFTYQPTADGQRFLLAVPAAGTEAPITVVLHWRGDGAQR